MESYKEMKERHQAEVNAFPFGFAFSGEQFREMMEKQPEDQLRMEYGWELLQNSGKGRKESIQS